MDKGSLDSEGLNGGRGLLKSLRLFSQLSRACGCKRAQPQPVDNLQQMNLQNKPAECIPSERRQVEELSSGENSSLRQ
ncbi:hypothetical protein Q8A67_022605 [Cirrhinus molitorella]|uniref:Uncharacterized protein n=1 Tax=Cirrhinus molitorella TaxID=172907 RepID=A0AA88PFZ5_9TELE|nr:hypothetical protein Q8A67_022605 [Cirrhinus molitorella]